MGKITLKTVGSVCSGIEAASVAWKSLDLRFLWFSEIADYPSAVLAHRYPEIPNVGDMRSIPHKLLQKEIPAPDLICGGTPCQAFSLAGQQNGLDDERGNLTLKFVGIVNANDEVREKSGLPGTIVLWENVEGVLTDKTNAFGCFLSSLAGLEAPLKRGRWESAGWLSGPKRNVAWRVLDAKYFGLPQQRRRLYVVAGGKEFRPEEVLFEKHTKAPCRAPVTPLKFEKDGHAFEVFREYTDCLYAAYGTKWNGNAAATNGSLFVLQDSRLRRLSPVEAERLMGFPDGYTELPKSKKTSRYQVIGNSWAVPVIRWIGERLLQRGHGDHRETDGLLHCHNIEECPDGSLLCPLEDFTVTDCGEVFSCGVAPEDAVFGDMREIVCADAPTDIYISPVGCDGILRRSRERNLSVNPRLKKVLERISAEMPEEEIEARSKVQRRGKYSK